jgi:antitoxin (DNA-binding transcriptional repressor) of toxin-antitoxin stability system
LSELLKCAQAGEEVIIANRGRPIMRLVPIEAVCNAEPPKGSGAAIVKWLNERDALEPPVAYRSHEEIEAAIQEARDAWD